MVKMTAEESSFEMIPEGEIVAAKVVGIEGKTFDWGDRLNWKFEVTEKGVWEGYKINGSTSRKFTIDPSSKFYEWSVELLGRTFDVGESVETDDLIGLPWLPQKSQGLRSSGHCKGMEPTSSCTAGSQSVPWFSSVLMNEPSGSSSRCLTRKSSLSHQPKDSGGHPTQP
jgi:hypothetical protein